MTTSRFVPKPRPIKNPEYILKRHKISQRRFAELLGMRVATVNEWITGKRKPSRLALKEIQRVHETLLAREKIPKKPPLASL